MKIRPVTDKERATWPKTVKVPLKSPFSDNRGDILPLVDLPIESCVLITSKKGSVRANHYHRTDWHFCYVQEGELEYFHRPHGSDEEPEKLIFIRGDLFFTGPMVDHAMVFRMDTVLVTLGRNSRRQDVYEEDVVRIAPINPE